MNTVGQPERATKHRVIALFRDELGYRYLGDWTHRDGNSNVEEGLLSAWLAKSGYSPAQIGVALHKLRTEANNHSRGLYDNNRAVYSLLRYGVPVKTEAGRVTETVHLINWADPEQNDFAIAEEVTLTGGHERRPDLVLYVNGIATGLLELIVKTGIAGAIAGQLGGLKGNRNAIAETIENNVRRTIVKEHLNDPAYYAKMSALLDEIIAARKARAIEYEEYLKRIAELAQAVEAGKGDDTPEALDTPGKRALFNNLRVGASAGAANGVNRVAESPVPYETAAGESALDLALRIDEAVKQARPDGWRGSHPKEQVIKHALYGLLQDIAEVERIFLIVKAQGEY
jgi:hypothetical protein